MKTAGMTLVSGDDTIRVKGRTVRYRKQKFLFLSEFFRPLSKATFTYLLIEYFTSERSLGQSKNTFSYIEHDLSTRLAL